MQLVLQTRFSFGSDVMVPNAVFQTDVFKVILLIASVLVESTQHNIYVRSGVHPSGSVCFVSVVFWLFGCLTVLLHYICSMTMIRIMSVTCDSDSVMMGCCCGGTVWVILWALGGCPLFCVQRTATPRKPRWNVSQTLSHVPRTLTPGNLWKYLSTTVPHPTYNHLIHIHVTAKKNISQPLSLVPRTGHHPRNYDLRGSRAKYVA